jgi:acetyl esterase
MSLYVDPQMTRILTEIRAAPGFDFMAMPVAEARIQFEAAAAGWNRGAPAMDAKDVVLAGAEGPMRGRLFRPNGDPILPVIIYAHGGGWTFGSLETHDGTMRNLAAASGCAVLGVDYRLAPEHPFPAPHQDVLAAIACVEAGGLGPGIDRARWAIAGDSAGATLALSALIARRDAGLPQPAAAALFYGCYAPDFETPSHARLGTDYLLTTAGMRWYWRNYLGANFDAPAPLATPLRADLSGLAPLYIVAAGLDPLSDDTTSLATRLASVGASFRYDHVPGVVHGFLRMARELKPARDSFEAAGDYIARKLKNEQTGEKPPWNAGNSSS